jgi:hypothetical protein
MEINSFHNGVLGLLIQIQRAIKRRIRVTAPVWAVWQKYPTCLIRCVAMRR